MKNCPFCAETIQPDATLCRHCGRDVVAPAALLAERDELSTKLATMRERLQQARAAAARNSKPFRKSR